MTRPLQLGFEGQELLTQLRKMLKDTPMRILTGMASKETILTYMSSSHSIVPVLFQKL